MKKILTAVLLFTMLPLTYSQAQSYEITFKLGKSFGDKLYIGRHYTDKLEVLDSAQYLNGGYIFKGKKKLERNMYCLISSDKKKSLLDFALDDSYKFSITTDSTLNAAKTIVKGSNANQAMFNHIAKINDARDRMKDISTRLKSSDAKVKEKAEKEQDALNKEMETYQKEVTKKNSQYRFFQLIDIFGGPEVPDNIENKPVYYRTHYWDGINLHDHSLLYTNEMFNKMNLYFFGLLYHADADTICKYADNVLTQVQNDTATLRYFMEFIMPRYYRSTKNVGWDQVWCYLVRKYYLAGKCTWATEGDLFNKRQTVEFLEKSLIGAQGAELFMSDTAQSENSADWISSHRFPNKYVILWFWDPDCHHCQEQTATLKTLYDSLTAVNNKIFEVYAIGYEADVAKWKNYVIKHNLPFMNVGGSNVNIDYQEAYNVHGAPTMIILNADRQIIMNKTLPTSSILPFIKEYEKLHPEQANRQPSRWQLEGAAIWGPQGFNAITNPVPHRQ